MRSAMTPKKKKKMNNKVVNGLGKWDYENASLPSGFDVSLIKPAVVSFLRFKGYSPINLPFTMVVSDSESPDKIHKDTYKALSDQSDILIKDCQEPGVKQKSDLHIYDEIYAWLERTVNKEIFVLIAGDGGYVDFLKKIQEAGHDVVVIYPENATNKRMRAFLPKTQGCIRWETLLRCAETGEEFVEGSGDEGGGRGGNARGGGRGGNARGGGRGGNARGGGRGGYARGGGDAGERTSGGKRKGGGIARGETKRPKVNSIGLSLDIVEAVPYSTKDMASLAFKYLYKNPPPGNLMVISRPPEAAFNLDFLRERGYNTISPFPLKEANSHQEADLPRCSPPIGYECLDKEENARQFPLWHTYESDEAVEARVESPLDSYLKNAMNPTRLLKPEVSEEATKGPVLRSI